MTGAGVAAESGSFSYHNPVRVQFGAGCWQSALSDALGGTSARVALFYGGGSMKRIGAIDAVKRALPDCEIEVHGGIPPNPDIREVEAALDTLGPADWVIGIGGGSVLDVAKSVAFMARQEEGLRPLLAHRNERPPKPSLPFIAIPTTSGTGSEVTPWATVWDNVESKKHSLSYPEMFPTHAIVDPTLTLTAPHDVTAQTAFDALAHALEAYWSRHANPVSDQLAVEAVRLILDHLEPVIADPDNLSHRSALAMGSLHAGLAFSNTQTTAVHAVSYPMTLNYGVPHGAACSLTLAAFWLYNLEAIDRTKVARLMAAVGGTDPGSFALRVTSLAERVGVPVTLSAAGIPREGIDVIIEQGFHPERVVNNPRRLTAEDLREILERLYE